MEGKMFQVCSLLQVCFMSFEGSLLVFVDALGYLDSDVEWCAYLSYNKFMPD